MQVEALVKALVQAPKQTVDTSNPMPQSTTVHRRLVLSAGRGARLQRLSERQAELAVPRAGMLTIIDFQLSDCVNSGIRRIAVMNQTKAQRVGETW